MFWLLTKYVTISIPTRAISLKQQNGTIKMISGLQILLARTALRMNMKDFSSAIGVSKPTLSNYENGANMPADRMKIIRDYCISQGLEFTDGDGVKFRTIPVKEYEGTSGFRQFMDDVYETANDQGGEIVLFNGFPDMLTRWLGEDWYKAHAKRMKKIKNNFTFRVTLMDHTAKQIGSSFANYRYFPTGVKNKNTIYVYGNKTAFLSFEKDVSIVSIEQDGIADAFRELFNIAWDSKAEELK